MSYERSSRETDFRRPTESRATSSQAVYETASAQSDHDAREHSTSELNAPSASQTLGCCKRESSCRADGVALPLPGQRRSRRRRRPDGRAATNADLDPHVATHWLSATSREADTEPRMVVRRCIGRRTRLRAAPEGRSRLSSVRNERRPARKVTFRFTKCTGTPPALCASIQWFEPGV
jgi:hypothetical protein